MTRQQTGQREQTEQRGTASSDLIALLDAAELLPSAVELRDLSYDALHADHGSRVVDVGCGAGRAVAELGERGVQALGVDPSERMIAVARRRWPDGDFRIAGAYELPLSDASVDGYRADKVFHELTEPARALGEALRVLRPGGRIVLVGQDWDAFVIDSDDPALTRTLVHARADLTAAPRAARRYRNLLLDAGFGDVTVEVRTGVFTGAAMLPLLTGLAEGACSTGVISLKQKDSWIDEQRARADADRLFLALPMFIAAPTAPRPHQ
jgi:SAM-dependent methyltransferase